jgi:hypothetical protein
MTADATHVKPRVLVLCRPYLVPDFRDNVAALASLYDFQFITDGRSKGVADTRARFYARLGKVSAQPGWSDDDEADVIARCRYLRHLDRGRALGMLRAMASVLAEEIERVAPVAVLSHMVDDYVTHLMAELSRRRGLVFVGYAYSYFPGKVQVTRYGGGEPHNLRDPPDDEVRGTLDLISARTFRQDYLQKDTYTRRRHLVAMLRYRVKQVVFALRARRDRDPLHVHYGCLPYVVERRHWSDFPSPSDFHPDWRERVKSSAPERPLAYLPLGYFPEATIDYWIEEKAILDYENVVLKICELLGREFRVVVKEHLHMLGARDPRFYRALRDTPGVVSVPPAEFSNDVLAMSDVVLLGAGSVGVEAYLRGKPIVSFCARSYWFAHAGATHVRLSELERLPEGLRAAIRAHVEPSPAECFEFVRECLRSTMRMRRRGKVWPVCEPDDLRRAIETK